MDDSTRNNWQKVKTALEASGKTSCHIYVRACAAVRSGYDPGFPMGNRQTEAKH